MEKVLRSRRVNEKDCSRCNGEGRIDISVGDYREERVTCPTCKGKGAFWDYTIEEVGVFDGICGYCRGRIQTINGTCDACYGTGKRLQRKHERDVGKRWSFW
jgi:DnaJ-class molecular chaperone